MSLFFGKTLTPQNGLLIFPGKETHSETKSWKSPRILTTKSYNNNGKSWKSSRILRVNPFFSIFHFSFFFIFFHFLSFSFIFFHFLSLSFIFFHFLSFSLSLLGAQNLIFFLGLNFVTISLDSSYVKNQFLGPSRGVPHWTLFSFCSYFFFSPVFLSFFLLLIFSIFLFFCSFLHFLICFSFSLFHFSEEKVSSFLFSCISSNIFDCWR